MDDLDDGVIADVLRNGDIEVDARMLDASNVTLVGTASRDGVTVSCVYKPTSGERPLWDFPRGTLARREVATYEVSHVSGWDAVPPTVWRDEGPVGAGMCQLWIENDPKDAESLVDLFAPEDVPVGWYPVVTGSGHDGRPIVLAHADDRRLANLAVLDAMVNNADRKGGHLLVDATDHVYAIDHGLCFHEDTKLRTVLWGWSGSAFSDDQLAVLHRMRDELVGGPAAVTGLRNSLESLLSESELNNTLERVETLVAGGHYPTPSDEWPALPWPVF